MVQVTLIHDGGARFHAGSNVDREAITKAFEKDARVSADLKSPRSKKQNRWWHATLQTAFHHQIAGPEFSDWYAMRSYLLIQAGWYTEWSVPWVEMAGGKRARFNAMEPMIAALAAGMRKRSDYVVVVADTKTERILFREAKSFSAESCPDHDEAQRIIDKTMAIIFAEILPGWSEDDLKTASRVPA